MVAIGYLFLENSRLTVKEIVLNLLLFNYRMHIEVLLIGEKILNKVMQSNVSRLLGQCFSIIRKIS